MDSMPAIGQLSTAQKICVGLILLLGAYLRFAAVAGTVVDHPFRSDAATYYKTAYNLNVYGVYSHIINENGGQESAPQPDAFVTPGYPLFLSLFIDTPPKPQVFLQVALWQACMGAVTLLLVFGLFRHIGGFGIGAAAMLLTAISPHQVNTVVFMVTETWFTLLLILSLVVFALHLGDPRRFLPCLLAAGLLFGIATLTRPVLEFFPLVLVALLFITHPRRQAFKGSVLLLAGFLAAWLPWLVRNEISTGRTSDPTVMVTTLASGMYPDFEYDHNPASLALPYKFDPHFAEITKSMGSTLTEIGRRFREDTVEETEWYLVGKPVMLWSWEVIEGGWDAYVYPVKRGAPYETNGVFRLTHAIAYPLHWPLVILAFLTSIYVWLPSAKQRLHGAVLVAARSVSLLLFYNTAVLMVLAPFVRYSIPFLPLIFGMGALGALLAFQWLRPHYKPLKAKV